MEDRDHFAAAALTGLMARRDCYDHELAILAYDMADAMLRERERTTPKPQPRTAVLQTGDVVSYAPTNHEAAPAARANTGDTHRSVEESSRPRRAHNPEIAGANPAAPTLDAALEAIADLPDERPPNAVSANGGTACAASRDGSGTSNTPPPHPTPPQGSVQDEGGVREPVAWAVMERDGFGIEGTFTDRDEAAEWCDSRQQIVPLYSRPSPPLGDPEIAVEMMKDRVAELETAIRRLADQDATLSVCEGNVTVTMDATLTDAEREAVRTAMNAFAEDNANPECAAIEATLWGLLERLGGGR